MRGGPGSSIEVRRGPPRPTRQLLSGGSSHVAQVVVCRPGRRGGGRGRRGGDAQRRPAGAAGRPGRGARGAGGGGCGAAGCRAGGAVLERGGVLPAGGDGGGRGPGGPVLP